jgi:UTP:GlnB (protein PII) uridylyltransferase
MSKRKVNTEQIIGVLKQLEAGRTGVLIDTKGNRAIDVFYVAHQGSKLSPETQSTLKQRLLAAC